MPSNPNTVDEFDPSDPAYTQGMMEWHLRQAIRDLRLIVGFDAMREKVADIINDMNPRKPS